jgi:hypothetical protein
LEARRKEQPGGDAQQRLTDEQHGVAVRQRVDDAAGDAGDDGQPNQRDRRVATQSGAPEQVGDGDRTCQHSEGDTALRDGQTEVVGDGRKQGRQHLLARGRDEVRQAEHGKHAPMWTDGTRRRAAGRVAAIVEASRLVHFAYSMQSREWPAPPRRGDDRRAARPRSVTDSLGAAFAAWGRGEAATTRRVRAAAGGLMASAMAAVVPPYSGGKVYATRDGAFTFVIVLFDDEGRLVCTLDGDTITRLRTPAVSALAIRTPAAADSTTAALIGTGRQAWTHLEMLARELPASRNWPCTGGGRPRFAELVDRARAAGIPAVPAANARARRRRR